MDGGPLQTTLGKLLAFAAAPLLIFFLSFFFQYREPVKDAATCDETAGKKKNNLKTGMKPVFTPVGQKKGEVKK